MSKLKELREKRGSLLKQQQDLFATAEKENRSVTEEELQTFDKIEVDIKANRREIEALETLERSLAEANQQQIDHQKRGNTSVGDEPKYEDTFWRGMRHGVSALNEQQRSQMLQHRGTDPQIAGTDSAGGYTVPEGFSGELFQEMALWGGMLQAGRLFPTTSGNPIKWPTNDDTANKGAILGETAAAVVSDTTFASKTLEAYTYTSNMIKVSMELMQDSAFDMAGFIRGIAARRLGTAINEHLTTGDGTGKPNGVLTAAGAGLTAAAATAFTRNELVSLIHSVDPAYRNNAVLMFNDATLSAIKKLSFGSADDRPLWQQSIREGEPDRIEGYRYIINQDMPDVATGNKAVAFGDFSKYIIRQVGSPVMLRLNERYAEFLHTAFIMYQRIDGELLSNKAIKVLTMA